MKLKKHGFSVVMTIIICAIFIFGSCEFYHIGRVLSELQRDVNTMNIHSDSTTQTEYIQTIDFLENEIAKYREFMEKQQEFLIWLIGAVGVALTGIFAFFEIKGREDISNIIREQYANQIQEEMGGLIGGQDKIEYLMDCVKKEEAARNKKILFVFYDNENLNLKKVYGILEQQKYSVQMKKFTQNIPIQNRKIRHWTKKYDIIVYQVGDNEFTNADENITYARISRECNDKEVYCILYSEKNIDRSLYASCFYVSNANYGLTVIERISNLLYSI